MVQRREELVPHHHYPAYVVWELTLRCDQPCTHCGSRAGDARPDELSTAEAIELARQLSALGSKEVVLIGGEAYLHPGFLEVIAALEAGGIRPTMTTGGRGVSAELARSAAAAGLYSASVSIDGLETTHDLMRAARGSFASATAALGHLRAAGVKTAANTNLNRFNVADLEGLYDHLARQGIVAWQVQLTAPLGRAADRPEMLLQPFDLLDVVPRVAALKERARADGILVMPGNNPFCHFRARSLAKQGKRERLIPAEQAPGRPFDNGRFEVRVEPIDAPDQRAAFPAHLLRIKRWSNRQPLR